MSVDTLKQLYLHELKDLYSADKQARGALSKLAAAASHADLKGALEASAAGCTDGMDAISSVLEAHGEKPTGKHCKGMEGLVNEAEAHALKEDFGDSAVQDASIISQAQRMTHYALAGYGTAEAFAKQIGCDMGIQHMKNCLDATYDGDRTLTKLAEGAVNENAAA